MMPGSRVVKEMVSLFLLTCTVSSAANAENLSEIFQLALQNDPILKQAKANQLAIGESKDQSIARFLPTLSATGTSSRDRLHNKKAGGDFRGSQVNQNYWNNTFNLNLTQPLFHWEHWVQLSQSENQIVEAEASYQAELQNLMVKTATTYFRVLAAQDNLQFSTAEKLAISRQLDQAQERFEVGLIAITDVNEALAGYDQASANEIEAANILDNQKEALREIIGDNAVVLNRLGEQLPLLKPEPADISAWSESAETANLSIISALNKAEISRKTIDLQRSGHLPQLDLVASYGASDVNSSFGLRGDTQSVGLQLNVPLFEGGAVNSRTRQASYEYEAAKENLTATKRAVKRQVKEAYRGLLSNISRVEALQAAVKSTESALEASQAGFEAGTRTMVDILAEQRNLYRVKRDYARARYDYLLDGIKLKQAASSLSQDDLEQINRLLTASTTIEEIKDQP